MGASPLSINFLKKKIRCERPKEMSGRFIAFVSGRQLKRLMTAIVGSSDLPAALVPVGASPWNSRPVVCGCVKLDIEPLCCCPLSGAGNQMFWPIGAPSKKAPCMTHPLSSTGLIISLTFFRGHCASPCLPCGGHVLNFLLLGV